MPSSCSNVRVTNLHKISADILTYLRFGQTFLDGMSKAGIAKYRGVLLSWLAT